MATSLADRHAPRSLKSGLTLRFTAVLFLFLVLLGGVYLAVSSAVAAKEYDSIEMNLAGRQRMLIQQYGREIDQVLFGLAVSDWEMAVEEKAHASRTVELFESTLRVFFKGGEISIVGKKRTWIPPSRDALVIEQLERVESEWKELRRNAVQAMRSDDALLASNDYVRYLHWQTNKTVAEMDYAVALLHKHSEARLRLVGSYMNYASILGVILFIVTVAFVRSRIVAPLDQTMTELKTEIAERKRVEEALWINQFAVDQASDAIYCVRADGRISYVNQSACEQLGYSYEELVSMLVTEIDPDFPKESWPAHWDEMKRAGAMIFEAHHQTKDGEVFLVEISTNYLLYQGDEYIWAYVRNITEAKQAENELRKLSVAVEQSPAAVLITDTNGTIEYVNPRFTEITGYTKEESIGQNPRILKSGKWPKKAYEGLWNTILDGKTWRGEFENKKKNGELYWESASISPVRNEQGEITHFLAVKEDITSRKKREQELRHAKTAAESANRAKSEFLANMSHEIRTPMTAILGFAENMRSIEQSESEQLDCIDTILRNGEYLLVIINDILDLSKIESGKMTIDHQDCQPCGIIAEVAALMHIQADAKDLSFSIEYIEAIPETIQSDSTRLRQILINLISNAIKFTETGAVRLVTRFVSDGDEPYLQFDVIDTGRGMTQEQVANLFQPFMQADNSTTRKFGGTGLGLTISKRFAELLGGDITVDSTEMGVGTTFRATVATGSFDGVNMLENPMSTTVVTETSSTSAQVTPPSLQGVSILLAEDGPDNQRLISFVLNKFGACVTVAENGQIALDVALAAQNEDQPFDVILMDMQMPVMDGYEATGQLRRIGYTAPIIALTAHALASDREKCIKAGCDDYATKPIDREKLVEMIEQYTKTRRNSAPKVPGTSDALVSELVNDDLLELVKSFVAELPDKIAAIEEAIDEQDLVALKTLAHQLKGSAGGYGFPSISHAAGILESSTVKSEHLETLTEQVRSLAELCRCAHSGADMHTLSEDVKKKSASDQLAIRGDPRGSVLVVDDDASARRLARNLLQRDGFQVNEACDGIEALAKLSDIHPHVILMDIEMPNMGGLECTRKLKADPVLRDIPIIIVSAKTDSLDVRAGMEAGAQEYITKPIQHDEFLLRVRAMNQLSHHGTNLLESNSVRGEQARAMGILFDLSRSLATCDSLKAIAQFTVAATAELVNSRRVSIMLPDDAERNLFVASAIGIDDALAEKIRVPVGSAIAGQVFESGEPTVFNSQCDVIDCTGRYESEFFASVPLASKALAVPNKVVGVLNVTNRDDQSPFEPHEIEYLDLVCNMTALAIEQFQSGQARAHAHAAIVIGLVKLAEHRDSDTGRHLERVTKYALLLARELRKSSPHTTTIDDRFLEHLEQSMPLHDIGKVSVPDAILLKPGPLTDDEFTLIKRHTDIGAKAIQSVIDQAPEAGFLLMARDIAHYHHEWFDGSGYPRHIAGEDIPLAARIAAIADVYDALTTVRPYKSAFPHEKAVSMVRESSGMHFDPEVVDVFLGLERNFEELAQELQDGSDDAHEEDANRKLVVCST